MTSALIEFVLSNVIVASLIFVAGLLLMSLRRVPVVFSYALLVLALAKLITPPLFALPIETYVVASNSTEREEASVSDRLLQSSVESNEPLATQASSDELLADDQLARNTTRELPGRQSNSLSDAPLSSTNLESDEPHPVGVDQETQSIVTVAPSVSTQSFRNEPADAKSLFTTSQVCTGVALLVWLGGSLWLLIKHFKQMRNWRRLMAESVPVPKSMQAGVCMLAQRIGLRSAPELLWTQARISPLAWGFGQARIVLPKSLVLQLSDQEIELLLLHELTHLKRRDHWIRMLEMVTGLAYWWLPTYWLTVRAVHQVEERLCDQQVIAMSPTSRNHYLEMLMKTVEFLSKSVRAPVLASQAISSKLVKRRFQHILEANTHIPRQQTTVTFLAFACPLLLAFSPTWGQRTFSFNLRSSVLASETLQQSVQDEDLLFPSIRIAGRVVDEAGHPASQAIVRVRCLCNIDEEVKCGEDGEFEVELKPMSFFPSALVTATSADGTLLGIDRRVWLRADQESRDYPKADITVKEPRVTFVEVRDDDGALASSIQVDAIGDGQTFGRALSNAQGIAKLVLPANAPISGLVATSDGRFGFFENLSFNHQATPNELPREVELSLMPCVSAEVQFVDTDGAPVPDVQLAVQAIDMPGVLRRIRRVDDERLISDHDGKVRIPWIPRQAYIFEVFPLMKGYDSTSGTAILKGPNGTLENQVIVLKRNGVISGRVTDEAGNPLASIVVQASRSHVTRTNSQGQYQLLVPANEPVDLKILRRKWKGQTARSHAVQPGQQLASVDIEATLVESNQPQATEDRDLSDPKRKFGKVVDEQGAGVANCEVIVGLRTPGRTNVESVTNADGVFEYVDYGDTPQFIFARHVQRNLAAFKMDLDETGAPRVVIEPAVEISGLVYDLDSQRISDAQVHARITIPGTYSGISLGIEFSGSSGEFVFRGVPPGIVFECQLLLYRDSRIDSSEPRKVEVGTTGPIELAPMVTPFPLGQRVVENSETLFRIQDQVTLVGSLSKTELAKPTFESNAESITVTGRTRNASTNEPIAGAKLRFNIARDFHGDDSIEVLEIASNAEGHFELTFDKELLTQINESSSIADVMVRMKVSCFGFAPIELTYDFQTFVKYYRSTCQLRMSPGRLVRGRLSDTEGNPLPHVRIVNIHNEDGVGAGPETRGETDETGRFEEWIPKNGNADLNFMPEDHAWVCYSIQRGDPLPDELEIVAAMGAEVMGTLLNRDGEPVANRTVEAWRANVRGERLFGFIDARSATTNSQGEFRVRHIKPGRYVIFVANDVAGVELRSIFDAKELKLAEGETRRLDLRAADDCPITVIASQLDGEPFDHAVMQLMFQLPNDLGYFWTMRRELHQGRATLLGPIGTEKVLLEVDHPGYSVKYKILPSEEVGYGNRIWLGRLTDPLQVELTYYRTPKLSVLIIDAEGEQVDSARVKAAYVDTKVLTPLSFSSEAKEKRISLQKQSDHRWTSYGLIPERELEVTISSPGLRPVTKRLTLMEGEERELTFRVGVPKQ